MYNCQVVPTGHCLCLVGGYLLLGSKVKDASLNVPRRVLMQLIVPLFAFHQESRKTWQGQLYEEIVRVNLFDKNNAYFCN
jgi:hypothetical protein